MARTATHARTTAPHDGPPGRGDSTVGPVDALAPQDAWTTACDTLGAALAQGLAGALVGMTRGEPEVTPLPSRVMRLGAWLEGLPRDARTEAVRLHPLPGIALAVIDPGLALAAVELLFGGSGRPPMARGGALTATGQRIASRLLERVLSALPAACEGLVEVEAVRIEDRAGIADPRHRASEDPVAIVALEIELGRGGGAVQLALPPQVLASLCEGLARVESATPARGEAQRREHLLGHVARAGVEIAIELLSLPATREQVLALGEGDVFELGPDPRALARVGGVALAECRFGTLHGRYAATVERMLDRADANPDPGGERAR